MCMAHVNGIDIYYERHGAGEPLLFLHGLGGHIAETPYLTDVYSKHFEFIVYDGRGCGRTDKPADPYSIAGLADDGAALLDAIGVAQATVYGSSMGGMVAQELVLRHPRKVKALILGCTTAGAIRGVRPTNETIQELIHNQSLSGDEASEAGWALGYSRSYIDANRAALRARGSAASAYGTPRDSYMRQVLAAAQHDTYDRLGQVTCPVMLLHGADDVMIPVGNAHMLKAAMQHAELHVLEGMGHGYNLEAQDVADALVIDFCARHAAERTDAIHAVR